MNSLAPNFTEYMMNRIEKHRDSTLQSLQILEEKKLISTQDNQAGTVNAARELLVRMLELGQRIQETGDLSRKLDLMSAQNTVMAAMTLLNVSVSNDSASDTRRINALMYLK